MQKSPVCIRANLNRSGRRNHAGRSCGRELWSQQLQAVCLPIHSYLQASLFIHSRLRGSPLRNQPTTKTDWIYAALLMLQKPWEAAGVLQYWGKPPARASSKNYRTQERLIPTAQFSLHLARRSEHRGIQETPANLPSPRHGCRA